MAMDPANLEGITERLAQVYSDAEVQLITRIAKSLDKGLAAPDWAVRQLAAVNTLGIEARGLLLELAPEVAAAIESALLEAASIGVEGADADIANIPGPTAAAPAAAVETAAVTALSAETVAAVTSTHGGILRSVADNYRNIVAEVAGRTITGVATRREVTQQALNKFADRGITGFVDRAGRNWGIDTYTEMAVRTATLRAMHTGHSNRLKQRGYDLVVVSSHVNPAPVCKEFEGKILSLTGATPTGRRQFDSARTGEPVTENVYSTMDKAEAKGLHHPNCRHRHTLFVPGVERPPVDTPASDVGYANEQQLRKLERDVRKWKRRQAAAITPEETAKAAAKVREKQAAVRAHVDATGVRRLRHREQLRNGDATKANDSATLNRREPPEPPAPAAAPTPDPTPPDAPRRTSAAQQRRDELIEKGETRERQAKHFRGAEGSDYGSKNWPYHREAGEHPFTEEERQTVSRYSEDGYSKWSGTARGTRPGTDEDRANIARLESAIDKSARVPDDIVVTRTAPASAFGNIKSDKAEKMLGKEFTDKGFMSTSLRSDGAAEQINLTGDTPYTMRLTVPAGSRGLFVSNNDRSNGRQPLTRVGTSEQELILPTGGRYIPHRIERDPNNPDGPVIVHATYTDRKHSSRSKTKPVGPYDHISSVDDIEAETLRALESEDFDALDALSDREGVIRADALGKERRNAAAREKRAAATAAKQQRQSDDYDAAIAEGLDDDEAAARAFGKTLPQVRRENAMSLLRGSGYSGKGFAELSRNAYADNVYEQYLAADNATNGYMLKRKYAAKAGDLDARLWQMNEDSARKYASEELLAHWDEVGRVTLDEFREQLVDPAAAARIRNARGDFNQ